MEDEDEARAKTPTPREIARAIVGGEPPEWLIDHFKNWAPTVMVDRAVKATRFKRADAKKWLTNVERAAQLLQQSLAHAPGRWLLEAGELGPIAYLDDVLADLADVEARAQTVLNSPMLRSADGSTPRGRGRASPVAADDPRVVVAGMIALAYKCVHNGRLPGPRNPAASEAADYFWRYVTPMVPSNIPLEKAISRGEDPRTKWRPYLEAALAQQPILGSNHVEFERHLRIGRDLAKRREAETEKDAPAEAKAAAVAKREGRRRRAKA